MQLTTLIERLSTDERAELAARWGLAKHGKVEPRKLAEAIGQAHVLSQAFQHLNALHLQVLRWLAELPGHEATWPALVEQVGDRSAMAYVEQQLQELRLWGLADFVPKPSGFIGTYPAVAAAFPVSVTSLRQSLRAMNTEAVRQVCTALGIKPPTDKDGGIAAVINALTQQTSARTLVDALPAGSRELLDWIRARGGQVTAADMASRPGLAHARQVQPFPAYSVPVRSEDPLLALVRRGLVMPITLSPYNYWYADTFVVPEELERGLAGGTLFSDLVRPPPLQEAAGATGAEPTPLHVARDIGHLLGFVESGRCEWRQDLQPYQRSLTALGKALKNPDKAYPSELWNLAVTAGLVHVADHRASGYSVAPVVPASPAALVENLVRSWALGGPVESGRTLAAPGLVATRFTFLSFLGSIPSDVWITEDSVLRDLAYNRPLLFAAHGDPRQPGPWSPDWNIMQYLVFARGKQPNGAPAILVPSATRTFLPGQGQPTTAALPPWDDTWTIQPDRTIIVPPNASPASLRDLWCVANLEDSQGASIFRLTADSVARALNRGMSPAQVEAILRRGSKTELPTTVQRLLQDQGQRYGQIKLGPAATYVLCEDPSVLDALVQERKLGTLRWKRLAPGVAAIANAAPSMVRDVLRKAGHLPVMDEGATANAGRGPTALAPMDAPTLRELQAVLREASRDHEEVAFEWRQNGRSRAATLVPYRVSGDVVSAYHPYSGTEYHIALSSLTRVEIEGDVEFVFEAGS